MRSFLYQKVTDAASGVQALVAATAGDAAPLTQAAVQPLAGGTTLLDLMKLEVMRPSIVVDINPLADTWSTIEIQGDGLRLGALARMSDVAANSEIKKSYPVIADSLNLAASPQLRNMATLGGNVLQRTRCSYFRDASYDNCNNAIRAPVARHLKASTAAMRFLGLRNNALPPIRAILRRL